MQGGDPVQGYELHIIYYEGPGYTKDPSPPNSCSCGYIHLPEQKYCPDIMVIELKNIYFCVRPLFTYLALLN